MRKCYNCIDSCTITRDGEDKLYCMPTTDDSFVVEIEDNHVCESHRYRKGKSDEKNYLVYDEELTGPGFFILHKRGDEIKKAIKISRDIESDKFTIERFGDVIFSFRDIEDDENGLFNAFSRFEKNIDKSYGIGMDNNGVLIHFCVVQNLMIDSKDPNYNALSTLFNDLSVNCLGKAPSSIEKEEREICNAKCYLKKRKK